MSRASPATVLVADDDPQFLRVMDHHLRSWAYRVATVGDKGPLLEALANGPPAVLLLDVRFGDHHGVEILRQIHADQPGVRVVMLTAYGSIDDAIAAMRFGAIDYLTKPIDLNRLRNIVADALASPRAAREQETPGLATSRPILGSSSAIHRLREIIDRLRLVAATLMATNGPLAEHFLARCAERCGRPELGFEPAALEALRRHAWPGNVRELENFVERLAVLSPGPMIGAADIRFDDASRPLGEASMTDIHLAADPALTEMEQIEKAAIDRALAAAGGNVRTAAQSLGLGQATVYRKSKKYGISTR